MHNGAPVHFMNRQQIQEIILRVLAECGEQGKRTRAAARFSGGGLSQTCPSDQRGCGTIIRNRGETDAETPPVPAGTVFKRRAGHLVTSKGRIENVAVL